VTRLLFNVRVPRVYLFSIICRRLGPRRAGLFYPDSLVFWIASAMALM
jgi:hypothetical protein